MKAGDKVVTHLGTGFVVWVTSDDYIQIRLDGGATLYTHKNNVWAVS